VTNQPDPQRLSSLLDRLTRRIDENAVREAHLRSLSGMHGTGTNALVTVTVDSGSVLTGVAFAPTVASATVPRLTEAVLTAYGAACDSVARAAVTGLPGGLASLVEQGGTATPDAAGATTRRPMRAEVRPLPGGQAAVDAWSRVDEIGVDAALAATPVPRLPVTAPGFDALMRSRMEHLAAAQAALEPELRAIRGRAETPHLTIEVTHQGMLAELSFRRSALLTPPEALGEELLAASAEAIGDARAAVVELYDRHGLAPGGPDLNGPDQYRDE
jgi:hypothetical protein